MGADTPCHLVSTFFLFYLRRRNFIIPFSSANRKGIVFIRLNCPLGSGDWNKQSGSERFFLFKKIKIRTNRKKGDEEQMKLVDVYSFFFMVSIA